MHPVHRPTMADTAMRDPYAVPIAQSWKAALRDWYYRLPLLDHARKRRLVVFVYARLAFMIDGWHALRRRASYGDRRFGDPARSGVRRNRAYRVWWRRYARVTRLRRRVMSTRCRELPGKVIPVVMSVGAAEAALFRMTAEAVRAQVCAQWSLLIIARDRVVLPSVRAWLTEVGDDPRIQMVDGFPGRAGLDALADCFAGHAILLEPGTLLHEFALGHILVALQETPGAALIYADEDRVAESGRHYDPYFKPDWSPELGLSQNLAGGFCVVRGTELRDALLEDAATIHGVSLRAASTGGPGEILHVARILQHRVAAVSSATADLRAAADFLERQRVPATAMPSPLMAGTLRIEYRMPDPPPRVCLIVPTRNGIDILRPCLESILEKTVYPDYELLIVDNGSDDPETLDYLDDLARCRSPVGIRIRRDDGPFNFSRLNNRAVEQTQAPVIGLINNDVEVLDGGWLTEMVSHALRPGVGAVGARLLYPDGRIQHAGVIVGFGDVAGSFMRFTTPADSRDAERVLLAQEFMAVTAACMILRREVFLEAGGFDERDLPVAFNDVDLCLRIRALGYRNLYTPHAVLCHHESATRGPEHVDPEKELRARREVEFLKAKWKTAGFDDPFYSPNLSAFDERAAYSFPPRLRSARGDQSRPSPDGLGTR